MVNCFKWLINFILDILVQLQLESL